MINLQLQKALYFAADKHRNQTRKSSNIPYIVHPTECMQILTQMNCNDDIIIAGILHDTIEDTDTTYDEISEKFGKNIADLVNDVTEQDKELSWQERKDRYFNHIEKCGIDSHYVCFADKLSNLRSIFQDYLYNGNDVWKRFNAGIDKQKWFYTKVYDLLANTEISKSLLYSEYKELLEVIFS